MPQGKQSLASGLGGLTSVQWYNTWLGQLKVFACYVFLVLYPNLWLKHNLWLLQNSGLCLSLLIPSCFVARQLLVFIPFPALPSSGWVGCTIWTYIIIHIICLYVCICYTWIISFQISLAHCYLLCPCLEWKCLARSGIQLVLPDQARSTNRPDIPAWPLPGSPHALPTVPDPIATPGAVSPCPGNAAVALVSSCPQPALASKLGPPVGPHPGLGSSSAGPDASGRGCLGCPPACPWGPPRLGGAQWPLDSGSPQPSSTLTLP